MEVGGWGLEVGPRPGHWARRSCSEVIRSRRTELDRERVQGGAMSRWVLVSLGTLLLTACRDEITPSRTPTSPLSTQTAVVCNDETAIRTVRQSVVRISTDATVGTGIVVGENQILTNAHVVEDNDTVRVESEDGAVQGTVVGTDNVIDLALIRAATRALPAVRYADPSSLRPGQRLLAIGYALDLPGEPSTTGGIFSALREIDGVRYVQTDTPINPGNSGGPLFTQCGEVVGLNTFAYASAELGVEGLGFAIESSVLEAMASFLDSDTHVTVPPPIAPTVPVARTRATPVPTNPPPVPMVCGEDVTVEVTSVAGFGQALHDGDELSVTVRYHAPGCSHIYAWFDGHHSSTSPWILFYCPQIEAFCTNPGTTLPSGPVALNSSTGETTLLANPGPFPPPNLSSTPNLEGFTACTVSFGFSDQSRGAGPSFYTEKIGWYC